jgi:hypothetical protein
MCDYHTELFVHLCGSSSEVVQPKESIDGEEGYETIKRSIEIIFQPCSNLIEAAVSAFIPNTS